MRVTADFQDMLLLLERHRVRYLIVGGYAFALHARPRYTKDLDIFVDPDRDNVERTNAALKEFGSPYLLDPESPDEILQIGLEPDRINLIRRIGELNFSKAWQTRVRVRYGEVEANWIGLEALIETKRIAGRPRDIEDAELLENLSRTGKA